MDYDANGVDRTLIRACLRETPLECLQMLEEMHQLAESASIREYAGFDLVHDRAPDKVTRLLAAFAELGATHRDDPRNLRPTESHLVGPGHQLQAGNSRFDVLGAIDCGGAYDELLAFGEVTFRGPRTS